MLQLVTALSVTQLLLLITGIYIFYVTISAILDPLRSVPGPFLARFTRLWYLFAIYKGNFELRDIEIHRLYGAIWRVAPGEYSIDDIGAAKTIYGHGKGYVKAPWYWAFMTPGPGTASLFADQDPHRHAINRRKISSLYSMTSLVGYEPAVNNCIELLTSRFCEIADAGKLFDFQHYLQCYAFDVIGEITFGKRFGFLDLGEDKEGGFGYIANWTLQQITAKKQEAKGPNVSEKETTPDFIARLLRVQEEDPEKITNSDLFMMCTMNIVAGSDTTAISLSSLFYHLMRYPQAYKKLQDEIDTAARKGRISNPITFKEAQDLPYLQAVIKEALRKHPAVGLPMQRVVPNASPITVAGHTIPPGSSVGINAWVAHQNTSVFGPDASEFRPERWLEYEEQGRNGEIEKYFLSFGMGSRTCIGKNVSLLEMSKVVPQMLRTFEFVIDESAEERVDGTGKVVGLESYSRWFVKQKGFMGRVRRR
ncbi:Cytochrome P450 [Glarea lozoyensis ATCC 20868]|uniref:Cytochrome P450 n=1 Tax=Glarea lozoyensis (strain ATCC 20868 / MF5171) TaxID=1116229 RepID=S3DD01_GLAL2|nr:Cytochrome P450 [Glarea lozoyensis ATCC 20868]EPE36267.1 Cytochrome P450 [Glarea lozoyensis ATCC 20868]